MGQQRGFSDEHWWRCGGQAHRLKPVVCHFAPHVVHGWLLLHVQRVEEEPPAQADEGRVPEEIRAILGGRSDECEMELRHASVIRGGVVVFRIIVEGLWTVDEAGAGLCTTARGWRRHREGDVDRARGLSTP